jgi:hypothetical protein
LHEKRSEPKQSPVNSLVITHCQTAIAQHLKQRDTYCQKAQRSHIGIDGLTAHLQAETERALIHAHSTIAQMLGVSERCPCGECKAPVKLPAESRESENVAE